MDTTPLRMQKPKLDVAKFVTFHKKRIAFLKDLVAKGDDQKLVVQVCFLGLESLAKRLHSYERDPGKRFILLLSTKNMGIDNPTAVTLWAKWRSALVHEGFISEPFTLLEGWSPDSFIIFPDGLKQSTEYPPESIIAIYNSFIDYFQDHCKANDLALIDL